jgi:hypothetical protein
VNTVVDRPDPQFEKLYPQLEQMADQELGRKVLAILTELWEQGHWQNPADLPTSPDIVYPNLPHTQCVVDLAIAIADTFVKHHGTAIKRDYLIAAAILQDASKFVEFLPADNEARVKRSDTVLWFGHSFWCAHIAVQHGLPDEIVHAILTHSPQAAKFPKTLEGKILYYADQLDVIAIGGDRWKKTSFIHT